MHTHKSEKVTSQSLSSSLLFLRKHTKLPHTKNLHHLTICNGALPSNHSSWPSLDIDPTHFLHRLGKLKEETFHRTLQDLVYIWERCGVGGESRVWLKQTPTLEDELVITKIKRFTAPWIHLNYGSIIVEARAFSRLEIGCVLAV